MKKNKEVEENINKKNNRPMFFLIGILMLCAVLALFYYIVLFFAPVSTVMYEGYGVEGRKIAQNLKSESFETTEQAIPLLKVEEQETIYKKLNDYYIGGDEKKQIDMNYPMYINDKAAVLNLSENMYLITKTYERVEGYPNFIMTEGALFNSHDLTKADTNEYLFIQTPEDTYVAVQDFKIKTPMKEYTIPVNSIIYFTEDYITYYEVKEDNLIYRNILDITFDSTIIIDENNQITYEEFLKKLSIKEEEVEQPEKKEENTVKEENVVKVPEKKDEEPKEETEYIKPTMSAGDFSSGVYTARTNVTIEDPQGRLTQATFIIKKGSKIYQRRAISADGTIDLTGLMPDTEFEIIGTYRYKNEEGKTVEVTFYNGKFKTKSLDELGSIRFEHTPGEIYQNKIELTNFSATGTVSDEIMVEVSKVEVEVDGIKYKLTNKEVASLTNKEKLLYQTSDSVASNKEIEYVIHAYDRYGNELKTENETGKTRTSKAAPQVRTQTKKQDPNLLQLQVNLENKDAVQMENYYYIISNNNGEVARSSLRETDQLISRTDLDPDGYFTIKYYADYDLEDGKGKLTNQLIGEYSFTTTPLSSLGNLYWKTEIHEIEITNEETGEVTKEKQLTSEGAILSLQLNAQRTDNRLIQLIQEVRLVVKDVNENEVFSTYLNTSSVRNSEQILIDVSGENIYSASEYHYSIETLVRQGNVEYNPTSILTNSTFTTLKRAATIDIDNPFATSEFIDFDVRVTDVDNAILTGMVRMEMRILEEKLDAEGNSIFEEGDIIVVENIETNGEFQRKIYNQLEVNRTYRIKFIAQEYNEGTDNTTFLSDYLIDTREFTTAESISGNIELISSMKVAKEGTVQNLINVESKVNWIGHKLFNWSGYYPKASADNATGSIKLNHNWSYATYYLYDLSDYAGQDITVSFKAKRTNTTGGTMYFQYSKTDTTKRNVLTGINNNSYTEYRFNVTLDSTGYIGFYGSAGRGLDITELYVIAGHHQTTYNFRPFNYDRQLKVRVNLADKNDQVPETEINGITDKYYYIRVTDVNDESNYVEIPYADFELIEDSWKVENVIKSFNDSGQNSVIREDGTYKIELLIKIRDRYYTLDYYQLEIDADDEIKAIENMEDYRNMQPYGHYILTTDIDFSGYNASYSYFTTTWSGNIDYNGYKITRRSSDTAAALFYNIGTKGILQNLVIDIRLDHEIEKSSFYGVFHLNSGLAKNIQINLIESKPLPNVSTALIGYMNESVGRVENFVINLKEHLYGTQWITAGVRYNRGTMRNGYAIGKNIVTDFALSSGASRYVGVINSHNYIASTTENVYSLVSVNVGGVYSGVYNNVANITPSNGGNSKVRNVYSVHTEGIGYEETPAITNGPNVFGNSATVQNNYYFSDTLTFNNTTNRKTTKLALYDTGFQNQILNSYGAFNVDELVSQGYYPHLDMPDVMPRQEYIELPEVTDADLADVLSTTIVEQTDNSATVEVSVHNPGMDDVIQINIQNLTTTIESQHYADGVTTVTLKITNPVTYVSKYNITSIKTVSAYGSQYERKFSSNERVLDIEFYRLIYTKEDWKMIRQAPTENFKLMMGEDQENALDFLNMSEDDFIINATYSGKLNGNGKTIKNLWVSSFVIKQLNGQIVDLNVENLNITGTTLKAGFIGTCGSANMILDDVHINGAIVNNTSNGTLYIGTLVGYTSNRGIIQNCSVRNVEMNINTKRTVVGGMIGYSEAINMYSCFARINNININQAETSAGVGGIFGKLAGQSIVENCYTTGNITSIVTSVGGIAGNVNESTIRNCYSNMNLKTSMDMIGGIIGEFSATGNVGASTKNLALGTVYAKTSDMTYVKRVVGFARSSTRGSNYAYAGQRINSKEISDKLDATALFTDEELKLRDTYETTLGWTEGYDLSVIENGLLPKLYYKDTFDLLPYQEDIPLKEEKEIEVAYFEANKLQGDAAQLILRLKTDKDISNVTPIITDMKVQTDNSEKPLISIVKENGLVQITMTVNPTKYYDSYNFTGITYQEGEETEKKTLEFDLKIDLAFYKTISTMDDWRNYVETAIGTYQNYYLATDLDFTGLTNMKTNLTIGRLDVLNTAEYYTIQGLTLTVKNSGTVFIKDLKYSMSNIIFDTININLSTTSTLDGIGIIGISTAQCTNLSFRNINIGTNQATSKIQYSGIIARMYGGKLTNINIENAHIKGATYIGNLVGDIINGEINTVTANNITAIGTGNHIGGIFGRQESYTSTLPFRITGITVDGATVSGVNYVGGIHGYALSTNNSTVTNSSISGTSYVGAIGGQVTTNYTTVSGFTSTGNTVTGRGNYVGGILGYWGYHSGINNILVQRCTIQGTGTNSSYVGGVTGYAALTVRGFAVKNCTISATKNYVGGVAATNNGDSNIYYGYVQESTITGSQYVGGILGSHSINSIYNCYVDADITGTNLVGGITGYLNNSGMTAAYRRSWIYRNYVANSKIEATSGGKVGGLIGNIAQDLIDPTIGDYYYTNLVEAQIISDDADTASPIIGGRKDQNEKTERNYIYKYSTINGTYLTNMDIGISTDFYVGRTELSTQSFYSGTSSKLSWGGYVYGKLAEGYYPTLSTTTYTVPTQSGIPLPVEPTANQDDTGEEEPAVMSLRRPVQEDTVEELPTVVAYGVDVNKFNIDFSNVFEGLTLTYKSENTEETTIDVTERTYTFEYNFQVPVTLTISNGVDTETVEIKPEEIRGTTSIVDGIIAYLEDGKLVVSNKELEESYVNLYDSKALMENGNIYDFIEEAETENEQAELELVETVAKKTYDYDGNIIETYGTYSIVNGVETDLIYTVVNNTLSITDGLMEDIYADKIVDSYNGKEYETILTPDGKLTDLKTPITYPKGFDNSNITSMVVDSENKQALVTYEDGKIVAFNYMTGDVVYEKVPGEEENVEEEETTEEISFMEYLKEQLSGDSSNETDTTTSTTDNTTDTSNVTTSNNELNTETNSSDSAKESVTTTYEETVTLSEKLEEKPIESETGTNADYVTVYDSTTDSYEIYQEDDLLNITEDEEVTSETQKIAASEDLKEYYLTAKGEDLENDKGAYFVIGSIAGVFVALILLRNYVIKRRRKIILAKKRERDRKRNKK